MIDHNHDIIDIENRIDPSYRPDGHTPASNKQDKDTNPKDVIGSDKLPLGLIPQTGLAHVALAFLEGALKYGRYNWRIAGVRASIYYDAFRRHTDKWWNGEDVDPTTRIKHLASSIACQLIILDAELCGMLNDDRPPRAPLSPEIDKLAEEVKYLKKLFADHHPHQYTIDDGPS